MSLILEALKKSEQQRRLGEAPNFGSPVVATRRRRNLVPVIAVLIIIAAAAGWWLMRRPPPAMPPVAPIANSTDAAHTATQPPPPIKRDVRPPAARPGGNLALDRTKQPDAASQEKRAGAAGNPARATPPPAAPAPTAPAAPSTKPPVTAAGQTAPTLADKSAGLRTTAPPPADAMQKPPAQKADVIAPPAPPANAQTAAATPAATAKPAAPGAALPSIWDLPFSTRKELPALDLSMHVYSADPKQRFVVMKGDRHVEGDEVGQDLILREIRQDGLVLDYKGQRFFFPRTGR